MNNTMAEPVPMQDSHFKMMSLIHNNPLRRWLNSPYKTLEAAGVGPGLHVLEIGCGPGFFTLPAAEIIGCSGRLYAIDIHPMAIDRVGKKLAQAGLTNVQLELKDAAATGLARNSIDVALVFGVLHSLPVERVFLELHRVLRPGGFVVVDGHRGGVSMLENIETGGLFSYDGRTGDVSRLKKNFVATRV